MMPDKPLQLAASPRFARPTADRPRPSPSEKTEEQPVLRSMKPLLAPALTLSVFGMCVGCGGGPLPGGLGPFAVQYLPDEPFSMDRLPAAVRVRAEAVIVGKKLEEVTRNARPSDGRYYYTIKYSDPAEGLQEICYWYDGTVRP